MMRLVDKVRIVTGLGLEEGLKKLHEELGTLKAMAERLQTSSQVLSLAMLKLGLREAQGPRGPRPQQQLTVLEVLQDMGIDPDEFFATRLKKTYKELAEELGVTPIMVKRYFRGKQGPVRRYRKTEPVVQSS
jgi:transcriptional regulator with XRE-family HTH domain